MSNRCSGSETLITYKNGTPIRKDTGCQGESQLYTSTTTLVEPVSYEWHLDSVHNPVIGRNSSYLYTFDNQTHRLVLVAIGAPGSECGMQVDIEVKGKVCPICSIVCKQESIFLPAGQVEALIDTDGKFYYLTNSRLECGSGITNVDTVEDITNLIKSAAKCQSEALKVTVMYNRTMPLCLMLHIRNSPIKFKFIKIDGVKYSFYLSGC